MKVYLKGSNRGGKKSKKAYKAGWYPCKVGKTDGIKTTCKLKDGSIITKSVDRFKK